MSYANSRSWVPGTIVRIRDDFGNEVPFMLQRYRIDRDAWNCVPTGEWLSDSPIPKSVHETPDGGIGWSHE